MLPLLKVIIVDDHKLFRTTFRESLSNYPDICVSGEAESGEVFFSLLTTTPCDLVLLDIGMPGMDGFEIARRLRLDYPAVKILAISAENTNETVRRLFETGIEGFISKQEGDVDEIVRAMRSIVDGYEYYGKDISTIIYQIYVSKKNTVETLPEFTAREKEIIELCRTGLIAKEIADRLNISVNTVHNHKNNIFHKFGINNMMEMVQYALKNNIIRP